MAFRSFLSAGAGADVKRGETRIVCMSIVDVRYLVARWTQQTARGFVHCFG
jgi:hypothetical protein